MELLLTAKLLIEAEDLTGLEPDALRHLDGAARIAFAAFLRPQFGGGVSLRTRITLDPADGDAEDEFPLSDRVRMLAAQTYTASLEEARGLAPQPPAGQPIAAGDAPGSRGIRILITAILPIEADTPDQAAEQLRPTDDAIRLMFYRSLEPVIKGGATQSTLVTLDAADPDAQAEFASRGWGARVSRLSLSPPSQRRGVRE